MSLFSLVQQSIDMRMPLASFIKEAGTQYLPDLLWPLGVLALAGYLIGSIPFAYIIVRAVSGEDITQHGTGNVGAMNVRRTTGSWSWFVVAMLADAFKGFLPTVVAMTVPLMFIDSALPAGGAAWSSVAAPYAAAALFGPQAVVLGAVVGHNYSLWLSLSKRRWLGGKGLATGGGALLAYNWTYFLVVLGVGLALIALTRYMMAGQVGAALSLPVYALVTAKPDTAFVVILGGLVYLRHHNRFVGLIRGREPRLYIEDNSGPRG
ncbi:MAG: glycerol-3-phosphate acyltransferase [Coriobacteriia bacterium]|jgi:glycerol-3-phosphate acyltransferase PlsY|nr:glycerol-3-phosphate acyltransferase [Coriobacteriia bacterium]